MMPWLFPEVFQNFPLNKFQWVQEFTFILKAQTIITFFKKECIFPFFPLIYHEMKFKKNKTLT